MKIKRILSCLLVLITILILPVSVSAYEYAENDAIIDFIPGDINGDRKVNATDARICLRAVSGLEALTDEQIKAVDFNGTGVISSANARSILRASSKLETITYTVKIEAGQRIVLSKLDRVGAYDWVNQTASTETQIDRSSEIEFSGDRGDFRQYFTIVTNEKNPFTVEFEQACPWTGEIKESFDLNIVIE